MPHHIEATMPIPHGVVFIYDPTAHVTVPPDTGAGAALATDDCLSLWTVHEVDGSTTLRFTDTQASDAGEVIFRGTLEAPGKKLAFNTSACEAIIQVELDGMRPHIVIYADHDTEPSKLVCWVQPKGV